MIDRAREAAFEKIVSSLNLTESFPKQVFRGDGFEFRFFESDRMFTPSFAGIIGELMEIEKSTSSCLLNLSRTNVPIYNEAAAIFFEAGMTNGAYDRQLRQGGPATGWLFSMDHYGCASDRGNWIMYCEKDNDIAVAALRGRDAANAFSRPLGKLRAEAIDALTRQGSAAPFPFSSLVPSWRTGLNRRYGAEVIGSRERSHN